jgi:hypothetical protein
MNNRHEQSIRDESGVDGHDNDDLASTVANATEI